jgi:hypothetical protein
MRHLTSGSRPGSASRARVTVSERFVSSATRPLGILQPGGSSPAGPPHSGGGKSGTSKAGSGFGGSSPASRARRLGPKEISSAAPGGACSPNTSTDRALGVEQGTDRTARQDSVDEAESARSMRLELRGGTPGHLLDVVHGDRLIPLAHFGRPPVANPLQQASQASVGRGLRAEDEPRSVPARLDLAALAGPAASLGHCPPEPFRPRRAELHRYKSFHPDDPNQPSFPLAWPKPVAFCWKRDNGRSGPGRGAGLDSLGCRGPCGL